MRSCEYSTTNKIDGMRKTKIITIENVRFFTSLGEGISTEIPQGSNLTALLQAECVSITFVSQKNGEKMATITQHRSKHDILCPVKAWATTINRILKYDKASLTTTVNTFLDTSKGKLVRITAGQIRDAIRSTVYKMGTSKLGVNPSQVGTHTVRSSCAMLLYLAQVRTSTIMLLGRWKSDAFLLYLRRQVKEFTEGVSETMTSQSEMFVNIPAHNSNNVDNRHTSEPEDPRTPSRDSIATASRFNGNSPRTRALTQRSQRAPAFRLWG